MENSSEGRIKCKCCGERSMIPMQLISGEEENQEELLYSCLICKDNWVANRTYFEDGHVEITFTHNVNIVPTLERKVSVESKILVDTIKNEDWNYYVGDHEIKQSNWFDILNGRRDDMFSAATN